MDKRYIIAIVILLILLIIAYVVIRPHYAIERISSPIAPVLILPGLGGSILEGKWDAGHLPFYCDKHQKSWTQIWPTAKTAMPVTNKCWRRVFRPVWTGSHLTSHKGVEIRPRGFGTVKGISIMDTLDVGFMDLPLYKYFYNTIHALKGAGIDCYAAPYDFRLTPDPVYMKQLFAAIKSLVERIGVVNLLGHSQGCVVAVAFLQQMSSEWKRKYIQGYLSVSGPYGGATKAVESILTGATEGLPVKKKFIRSIERKLGGVVWMTCTPQVWRSYKIVDDYTAADLPMLMRHAGAKVSSEVLEKFVKPYQANMLKHPGVKTYIFHGNGKKTARRLLYKGHYGRSPIIINGFAGDGTVNIESLAATYDWTTDRYVISGESHNGILNSHRFHRALLAALGSRR